MLLDKPMTKLSPLSIELPVKEDFLIDLKNNNYSIETVYNYGRDLTIFERFLQSRDIKFENIDKKTVALYKGFLRSGKHLEIINNLRDQEEIQRITANMPNSVDNTAKDDMTRSKTSLSDEKMTGTTRGALEKVNSNKLSSRSVNRMLSALRTYLGFLIEYDYKCPVPPEVIKLIKTERKESQVADLDELIQIIEAPEQFEEDEFIKLRNRAILEVLFSTGMRISELVNLDMEDINREGKIYIMGKGKKQRMVYLTQRARVHLNSYLKKRTGSEFSSSPALFLSSRGQGKNTRKSRITPRYVQMKIQEYRRLIGIVVPVTPHGLRHGFATYLAEEGANPAAIQRLLGHESLQTTTRYVHASDKFAEDTHKKFHPLAME